MGLRDQPATTITTEADKAADRFYAAEIAPREGELRRGIELERVRMSGTDRYAALSFAGIYVLVVWFDEDFNPWLVRERIRQAAPEIEALARASAAGRTGGGRSCPPGASVMCRKSATPMGIEGARNPPSARENPSPSPEPPASASPSQPADLGPNAAPRVATKEELEEFLIRAVRDGQWEFLEKASRMLAAKREAEDRAAGIIDLDRERDKRRRW